MRTRLWLSILIMPTSLHAQATGSAECPCTETLAFVIDQVERNYAGFGDQVTAETGADYRRLKAELRTRAASLDSDARCEAVVQDYISFFHDRHFRVSYSSPSGRPGETTPEAIRTRFGEWPRRAVSESQARAYLDQSRDRLDPVEGIWETPNSDYRVAILPADDAAGRYQAIILRADSVWWTPGQVKATLERDADGRYASTYYMRDHSPRETVAHVQYGVLALSDLSTKFVKVYPEPRAGHDPGDPYEDHPNDDFAVTRLDSATVLIQLPTFNYRFAPAIDSIVQANWKVLTGAPNLIIDLRGNGGGASASYDPLRPLFYTGPIITPGLSMYATEDNIRSWQRLVENPDVPDDLRPEVEAILDRMRENVDGFAPEPDDTTKLDRVLPTPRRIVMLTDRFCVSACEGLVLEALQSDKVTTIGTNTGGFLDYGNAMRHEAPCPGFRLYLPIARSNWLPERSFDYVGIPPEIRIPDHVLDPVEWVHGRLLAERDAGAWP